MEQTNWALNPCSWPPLRALEDPPPARHWAVRPGPPPGCSLEKGKGPSSPRAQREGHLALHGLSLAWASGPVRTQNTSEF